MRTTSPPETPFLLLGNGISLILVSFSLFTAFYTDNLLQNFQIALIHSILKLKSIVIPPNKMTGSGEKHAQDKNLIWYIFMALRPNLLVTVYTYKHPVLP